MDSLKKVLEYLWCDEGKHYFTEHYEQLETKNHIFRDLVKAKIWLYRQEFALDDGYSPDQLVSYMHVESPFDLASPEDDVYRELVDSVLAN